MGGFRYHSRQTSDSYRQDNTLWFKEGINAEILRVNSKGWQKGKIKIKVTVEFEPDEPEQPESPLDDIRQAVTQNDN